VAEVNKGALLTRRVPVNGSDPLESSVPEYGPPLSQLQSKARALGAFDVEAAIGRFDPDRITTKQKRQMRRDPMLKLGLHFKKTFLLNAPWHVECVDPQVAAFAQRALEAVYERLIVQMLLSLDFGYVPIVKRFQREVPDWTYEAVGGDVRPVWPDADVPAVTFNAFQALPPEGAEVLFADGGRRFDGFRHHGLSRTETGGEPLRVPVTHALWVTNEFDEEFGSWYGYPLTGYAFRYWWSYWYQWLLADRHMEQDADPPIKASYPPGSSPDPDDPATTVNNYVVALKAGAMIRDGATVAVPSDVYVVEQDGRPTGIRKWDMEFMRGGENIQAFHESFRYLDVAKLRAVLVPDQALIGASGSLSGNVAETYGQAFGESQAMLMGVVDQHINDYVLPDLVAQNFLDPPKVKKVTEGFRDKDQGMANDLMKIIAAADPGALQLDYRAMAQRVNLPTLTREEIEAQKEEAMRDFERQERTKIASTGEGKASRATRGTKKPSGDGGGIRTEPNA